MIKVLDKSIADKIAAGEVVERPLSIVKELVENSLDAGATSIVVEIKNGGKSYIRVTDNGCGIQKEQVEIAFLRHATSKIATIDDLDAIYTLGFRGEALASIGAVTRTELVTKCKDEKIGTRLVLHGGEKLSLENIGCPDGTTIIITDLFYNTPARQKFLKQDATESSLIIDFISQMALAYKDIRFRLINNGKILFSTLGDGDRLGAIMRIYGKEQKGQLVPLDYQEGPLSIEGYISTPGYSKPSRASQIFFVNGRVIQSKVIDKAITLGYKERLFEGRFPVIYLFLKVNPKDIDVNIHPNKKEVRFQEESIIISFISKAIIMALSTKSSITSASSVVRKQSEPETFTFKKDFSVDKETSYKETSEKTEQVDIKTLLSNVDNEKKIYHEIEFVEDKGNLMVREPIISIPQNVPFDFSELKVIGTVFNTYICMQDRDTFYLIDQHAAHERIFYEKLVGEYEAKEKDRQTLLFPIVFDISFASKEMSDAWLGPLNEMGFTISSFGPTTYRITEIPMFMELSEGEIFVKTFAENITSSTNLSNTVVINKLITMSCKQAIKANDIIKAEEIDHLISDLSKCVNPFSCPHGRPTFVKMSKYEIERMFKRV